MKLAYIETINEIIPIEGADRIELAKVQGWQSVVKRGEYSVGDRVVFIPIDTVLHPSIWNSYLHDKQDPTKPIRVRSVKLRGTISSGLIFPLSILEPFTDYEIGQDVADLIGVTKYEKSIPAQMAGKVKGGFPAHLISKTDEDNLLSNPEVLNELRECDYVSISLKLDGTSVTYIKKDGDFKVCSRNLELFDGDNVYWEMARKYHLMSRLPDNTSVQGEICGQGIQKNPLQLNGVELFIFNFKNLTTNEYINEYDPLFVNYVLPTVTNLLIFNKEQLKVISLEDLQRFANNVNYGKEPAEGIVIRGFKNNKTVYSKTLNKMLSVKVINQNYID